MPSLFSDRLKLLMLACCLKGIQGFAPNGHAMVNSAQCHLKLACAHRSQLRHVTALSFQSKSTGSHAVMQNGVMCPSRPSTSLHLLSKNHSIGNSIIGRSCSSGTNNHNPKSDTQQSAIKNEESGEDDTALYQPKFKVGDKIQVEVIKFGPLGASVDVVAHNSHNPADCIPQDEPALGRGMILQREISYFRRARDGVDVVQYEILPAYVENVREETFYDDPDDEEGFVETRLDVSLRPPGGQAKAQELGEKILEQLKDAGGSLDVGDKSTPEEINRIFPGASKGAFKKAVSGLYKRGLVSPGPTSISLM